MSKHWYIAVVLLLAGFAGVAFYAASISNQDFVSSKIHGKATVLSSDPQSTTKHNKTPTKWL